MEPEPLTPEEAEQHARYFAAAHAMQSGVAMMMNYEGGETTPKHLRVGVNSALVDSASLAMLLMEKGVFTRLEYFTAIAEGMEREVKLYQDRISERLYGPGDGPTITLA